MFPQKGHTSQLSLKGFSNQVYQLVETCRSYPTFANSTTHRPPIQAQLSSLCRLTLRLRAHQWPHHLVRIDQ